MNEEMNERKKDRERRKNESFSFSQIICAITARSTSVSITKTSLSGFVTDRDERRKERKEGREIERKEGGRKEGIKRGREEGRKNV